MSTPVDHTHLSGYFGAEENVVRAAYKSVIERFDPEFLTGTECEYAGHKKALGSFSDDYGMRIASVSYSDDTAILWKSANWKFVYFETYQITKVSYVNEKGLRRDPAYAKIVILEHRETKERVLISVCHLPSHVQRGGGFYAHSTRVRAWYSGVKNWRARRNELYRKFKCDAMLVSADWNIDLKSKFMRGVVKTLHPTMRFIFNVKDLPHGGTHGDRLIDFSLVRGKLRVKKRPIILRKSKASDHAPYHEALELSKAR